MRVLFVAQGLERARSLAAVSIHAPNKVVILRNTNEASPQIAKDAEAHVQLLRGSLAKKTRGFSPYPFVFEVAEEGVDFFDVVESYSKIRGLVANERESGNEVFFDVSSGAKPVAMAMFLAGQIDRVPTSYCKAAKYIASKRPTGGLDEIALSAKEPVLLPSLPLQIEKIPVDILAALAKEGSFDSVSGLVRALGRMPGKPEIMAASRGLERLRELGYVRTSRIGKRKRIEITSQGKQLAGMPL